MDSLRVYRVKDVASMVGLSRSEIYRRLKAEAFPRPVKLGARAVGWRSDDIAEWLRRLVPQSVP